MCAGTVNTTRLLQTSGIGSGSLLQSLGIPVVHDLPGVGENFQDHYFVRVAAKLKPGTISLNQRAKGLRLAGQIARWCAGMPSILTLSPSIAYAFLNSETISGRPDLQFVFTPGSYKPGKVYQLDDIPAATCGFTQQRPESIGHIRITSPNPMENPLIQPNYLKHETDQRVAVAGIRLSRKLMSAEPIKQLCDSELVPGSDLQSDDELLDFARQTGNTGYHLCGTCLMGSVDNPAAVVSPKLQVHGIDALRVVDASVMPTVTSSNTAAATIMIAEKGAEMILEKHATS